MLKSEGLGFFTKKLTNISCVSATPVPPAVVTANGPCPDGCFLWKYLLWRRAPLSVE